MPSWNMDLKVVTPSGGGGNWALVRLTRERSPIALRRDVVAMIAGPISCHIPERPMRAQRQYNMLRECRCLGQDVRCRGRLRIPRPIREEVSSPELKTPADSEGATKILRTVRSPELLLKRDGGDDTLRDRSILSSAAEENKACYMSGIELSKSRKTKIRSTECLSTHEPYFKTPTRLLRRSHPAIPIRVLHFALL